MYNFRENSIAIIEISKENNTEISLWLIHSKLFQFIVRDETLYTVEPDYNEHQGTS